MTDEQRDWLEVVRSCSDDLLHILNDILDVSKMQAGKLLISPHRFPIGSSLQRTAALFSARAAERNITILARAAANVPETIWSDETRIGQCLNNLIGNAIKFSAPGERVDVKVELAPSDDNSSDVLFHFSVQDRGIGIPAATIGSIFEAFAQADASTARKFGGKGLGLTIAKQIVELMGGKIWVESSVGVGSTFHFTVLTHPIHQELSSDVPACLSGPSTFEVNLPRHEGGGTSNNTTGPSVAPSRRL